MQLFLSILLFFFLQLSNAQNTLDAIATNLTFYVEHSLNLGTSFKSRTTAQLVPKPDGKFGLLFEDKNAITGDDVTAFKQLLSNNELYIIRISNHPEKKDFVVASIPSVSQEICMVTHTL
jgi:hypothetical protein